MKATKFTLELSKQEAITLKHAIEDTREGLVNQLLSASASGNARFERRVEGDINLLDRIEKRITKWERESN